MGNVVHACNTEESVFLGVSFFFFFSILYNILQGDSVLNAITVHSRAERRVSAGIAGKQNAVGGAGVLLLPNLIGAATQLAPGDRYMESL